MSKKQTIVEFSFKDGYRTNMYNYIIGNSILFINEKKLLLFECFDAPIEILDYFLNGEATCDVLIRFVLFNIKLKNVSVKLKVRGDLTILFYIELSENDAKYLNNLQNKKTKRK